MENESNLRTLAETAYESKNFDQAHEYYSRVLESSPADPDAWLKKGLAAGWNSQPEDLNLDELEVSLNRAIENGLSDKKKRDAAEEVFRIGKHAIKQTYRAFDGAMKDYDKKSMSTGELKAVRKFGEQTEGLYRGGELNADWYRALQIMALSCRMNPSMQGFKKTVEEIDKLKKHSNQNGNYLDLGEDEMVNREGNSYEDKLMRLRKKLVGEAKEVDSSFQPTQINTGGGGCFIATATLGNPYHPTVIELKRFRDDTLLENRLGRLAVAVYYKLSPPVARFIEGSAWLRKFVLHTVVNPLASITKEE